METLLNISQLAKLLDMNRHTLAGRLEDLEPEQSKTRRDGKADRKWHMADVHRHLAKPAVLTPVAAGINAAIDGSRPDEIHEGNAITVRSIEAARLARGRADDAELRIRQTQGELIPVESVVDICTGLVLAAKAKMQNVHRKLAARYPDLSQTVLDSVEDMLHEALEELGDGDLPPELAARVERYREQAV